MPTLLDTLETPAETTRQFGEELQASMAAIQLQIRWFGWKFLWNHIFDIILIVFMLFLPLA